MSADFDLTDRPGLAIHTADDCRFEQCDYCGCCAHGRTLREGCKVGDAPAGMNCPNLICGCEGAA